VAITLLVVGRARDHRRMRRGRDPRGWPAPTLPPAPWQQAGVHPADAGRAEPPWDGEPYRPATGLPFPPLAAQRPDQYEPPYPPAF